MSWRENLGELSLEAVLLVAEATVKAHVTMLDLVELL